MENNNNNHNNNNSHGNIDESENGIFENDGFFSDISDVNLDELLQFATQSFAAPASSVAFSPPPPPPPTKSQPAPPTTITTTSTAMPVTAFHMKREEVEGTSVTAAENHDDQVERVKESMVSDEEQAYGDFLQFTIKNELSTSQSSFCMETQHHNALKRSKPLDLSLNSADEAIDSQERINDSFAIEFARFQDDDFELPPLDVEFESTRIDASKNFGRLAKTQLSHDPQQQPDNGQQKNNVSSSCPLPKGIKNVVLLNDNENSTSDTNKEAAMNYLALNYSPSTSNAGSNVLIGADQAHEETNCDMPQLLRKLAAADASMMPASIKQLYDVIKQQYSDFAFIYALSAQLCQNRVPMDAFVQLKLALLLSLASIGTNPDCPPIPIIAIGSDTYMANYLLMQVGELAPRFIGPELDIKAPAAPTLSAGNTWIEADALLLAKGGVYFAGDWAHLKAARSEQLFKTVECARINLSNNVTCPLQTAMWAHWRSYKFNAKEQQIFNKFIKIFGIPIYIDDDHHEVLINYLLEQASVPVFESTIDHLSISDDDMRQFVELVSRRTVDTQPDAALLLQQYFVASRCERPDCLSQQAFVVLKQFAESFAKLSFRHEVNCLDALGAIYMCENFKQKFFGPGEEPAPTFEAHNYIWLVDEQLAKFREWLKNYINKYYEEKH